LTRIRDLIRATTKSRKLKKDSEEDTDLYEHELLLEMDYEDDEEERAIILNHKLTPVQRIPVKSQYEKPGLLDGDLSSEE
jgi:hypothetical protein